MTTVPAATAAQMARVDEILMDELGVEVLQLMETAGLAVAEASRRQLGGDVAGRRVLLLAGSGGNGGDALVAARHLLCWGASPRVVLAKPIDTLGSAAEHQARAAHAVGVPLQTFADTEPEEFAGYDLIVDGLLGFSGHGHPSGAIGEMIRIVNDLPTPVLAIDLPSGLDADTGKAGDPTIRADLTLALALPKQGFLSEAGRAHCGAIEVASIGVPNAVLARVGITAPPGLFARQAWLSLAPGGRSDGSR
jgi:NAD(P)H-hydrate epimerase